MADEKKIMDVAKPGDAKPDTGSKPMVIGHKSMASDPSVKIDVNNRSEEQETPKIEVPKKKLKIEPLGNIKEDLKAQDSDDEKPETSNSDIEVKDIATEKEKRLEEDSPSLEDETQKAEEHAAEPKEKPEEKPTPESEPETVPEKVEPSVETNKDSEDDKKQDIDNEQIEREEKLQSLIKSKEYNVAIREASSSALKTFFLTFIVVSLIGAVIIVLLIDAGILDLGVELPFDFIK